MNQAAQHSQRATELDDLLNVVKTRVQDLEDRCLRKAVQQQSHNQRLLQEKQEVQVWQQTLEMLQGGVCHSDCKITSHTKVQHQAKK